MKIVTTIAAIAGMSAGGYILIVGPNAAVPADARMVGGFLLVAGFCWLLRIKLPNIW